MELTRLDRSVKFRNSLEYICGPLGGIGHKKNKRINSLGEINLGNEKICYIKVNRDYKK
jgi:hypothetical protein